MSLFSKFKKSNETTEDKEKEISNELRIYCIKSMLYLDNATKYVSKLEDKFEGVDVVEQSEVEDIAKRLYGVGERLDVLCMTLRDEELRAMFNDNCNMSNLINQALDKLLNSQHRTGQDMIRCLCLIRHLYTSQIFKLKSRVVIE